MLGECRQCVNEDDPDVQPGEKDRIELAHFLDGLGRVNATVHRLRAALRREVFVYVASDTALGLHEARKALGARAVLTHAGQAVHTTRTVASATPDAVKVAVDFFALAISDVLLSLGASSFSGNAGALHGGIEQAGERSGVHELSEAELARLSASFASKRDR